MPSNLAKYSGLLEPHQENILSKFLESHDVSKAKVIGLLLEDWEKNNYPKFDLESDRPVKFSELETLVNQLVEDKLKSLNLNIPSQVSNKVSNIDNQVSNKVSNKVSKNESQVDNEVSNKVSSKAKKKDSKLVQNQDEVVSKKASDKTANQDIPEYEVRKDTASDYEKNLSNFAIETKAKRVKENANNIYVTEPQNLKEDNQQLPLDIDVQETIKNEDTITPEKENKADKSDSKKAKKVITKVEPKKVKPLSQDIVDKINLISSGTELSTEDLCKAIGIRNDSLSRYFESKYSIYFKKKKGKGIGSPITYTRL